MSVRKPGVWRTVAALVAAVFYWPIWLYYDLFCYQKR